MEADRTGGGDAVPGGAGGPEGAASSRARLEICQGSSCREVGNEQLLDELERLGGLRRDRVCPGKNVDLIAGICQGRCAIGPNVRLNGEAFSVAGPSEARELLERAEASVKKSA